jgi:hypothetical protein
MIGLVHLDWQTQVQASQIDRVTYDDVSQTHTVYLSAAEYGRKLTNHAYEHLTKHPLQLLAAEAGTKLCQWDLDAEEPEVWFEPVIAWALCLDGEIRPATPCGVDDGVSRGDGVSFVKMPDGYIKAAGPNPDVVGFQDEASLLIHLLDERRIRREHREAARQQAANGEAQS